MKSQFALDTTGTWRNKTTDSTRALHDAPSAIPRGRPEHRRPNVLGCEKQQQDRGPWDPDVFLTNTRPNVQSVVLASSCTYPANYQITKAIALNRLCRVEPR